MAKLICPLLIKVNHAIRKNKILGEISRFTVHLNLSKTATQK